MISFVTCTIARICSSLLHEDRHILHDARKKPTATAHPPLLTRKDCEYEGLWVFTASIMNIKMVVYWGQKGQISLCKSPWFLEEKEASIADTATHSAEIKYWVPTINNKAVQLASNTPECEENGLDPDEHKWSRTESDFVMWLSVVGCLGSAVHSPVWNQSNVKAGGKKALSCIV